MLLKEAELHFAPTPKMVTVFFKISRSIRSLSFSRANDYFPPSDPPTIGSLPAPSGVTRKPREAPSHTAVPGAAAPLCVPHQSDPEKHVLEEGIPIIGSYEQASVHALSTCSSTSYSMVPR
jgi:hypothetical protein